MFGLCGLAGLFGEGVEMTPERLEEIKTMNFGCDIGPRQEKAIEELIAEVERLTLENLELEYQVAADHGTVDEMNKARADVDAEKARQQRTKGHGRPERSS